MRRAAIVILATAAIAIILLYVFAPALASYDSRRIQQHREPLFARLSGFYHDGGTTLYEGPGYELKAKHRLIGRGDPVRYDTGIALSFSLPFYKRFNYETRVESAQ